MKIPKNTVFDSIIIDNIKRKWQANKSHKYVDIKSSNTFILIKFRSDNILKRLRKIISPNQIFSIPLVTLKIYSEFPGFLPLM